MGAAEWQARGAIHLHMVLCFSAGTDLGTYPDRRGRPRASVVEDAARVTGVFTGPRRTGDRLGNTEDMGRNEDRLLAMTDAVLVEINALDPYGLAPGEDDGAPLDEYDLEANPIARLLLRQGHITLRQVDGVWAGMFSQTLTSVIGAEETNALVTRLNQLHED